MPAHIRRFYKVVDVVEHPASPDAPKLQSRLSLSNLSLAKDTYYAVTLDGKVIKTLYQDALLFPSRALATAIAEEWDMQGERVDTKTLKLNAIMAKAVRTVHDPTLVSYMRNQIHTILTNDQICY